MLKKAWTEGQFHFIVWALNVRYSKKRCTFVKYKRTVCWLRHSYWQKKGDCIFWRRLRPLCKKAKGIISPNAFRQLELSASKNIRRKAFVVSLRWILYLQYNERKIQEKLRHFRLCQTIIVSLKPVREFALAWICGVLTFPEYFTSANPAGSRPFGNLRTHVMVLWNDSLIVF